MKKESTIGLTYILKSFSFALAQQQAARTVCRLSPVSLFGSNQAQKEQEGKEFTKVDKSAHSFFFFFYWLSITSCGRNRCGDHFSCCGYVYYYYYYFIYLVGGVGGG